jgi:hypothetical protein
MLALGHYAIPTCDTAVYRIRHDDRFGAKPEQVLAKQIRGAINFDAFLNRTLRDVLATVR